MDTPGIVCRDTQLFHRVAGELLGPRTSSPQAPRTPAAPYTAPDTNQQRRTSGLRNLKWPFSRSVTTKLWLFRAPTAPLQTTSPQLPIVNELPMATGDKPIKLLYPLDYWNQWSGSPGSDLLEDAVGKLEQHLGVRREVINLEDKWLECDPAGTQEPLKKYLQDVRDPRPNPPFYHKHNFYVLTRSVQTFMTLLWKGYYDNFLPFREEYELKYGSPPYVHPVIQECW